MNVNRFRDEARRWTGLRAYRLRRYAMEDGTYLRDEDGEKILLPSVKSPAEIELEYIIEQKTYHGSLEKIIKPRAKKYAQYLLSGIHGEIQHRRESKATNIMMTNFSKRFLLPAIIKGLLYAKKQVANLTR